MNNYPDGWPTDWEGESLAEIGDEGRIRCKILLTDGHAPTHLANYMAIRSRWAELWPAARELIQAMLVDYGRDPRINRSGNYLQLTIPAEPIAGGTEWSIALIKDEGNGTWDARFVGWEISPDDSQPFF